MHPELLLSQILKAKYFPRSSLLLAEVGDRPSLRWRSILSARTCLEMGLRRRIGSGESTPIWGESWMISEDSGKVITSRPIDTPFPNVGGDLIDWSTGTWNSTW